ncbi:hypothetical protein DPMN_087176 [Dreissena polymorpha]|uniref:Uncharacterized protein n=1 Tax=Dreissena polymorpha TaxID=45954 RepID=A0A9D4KRS0_DREPO|nr:hypothetical protein DPMN_087176 [Dreissena polymorpha]
MVQTQHDGITLQFPTSSLPCAYSIYGLKACLLALGLVRVLFICIIQQKNVPSLQFCESQYCRVQHKNCEVLN